MCWIKRRRHISSFQIIIVSFLIAIIVGALLLMLPIATRGAGGASFLDALFTSTSAVCVTGLVVHDTATYWSLFGQMVILCLIQIGGLGVVTVALTLVKFSGRKIGLTQRSAMQEAIAAPSVGGIIRMTGFISRVVVIVELLGAVSLATQFCPEFGFLKGSWYAVFHSVSAFCNAGFDLIGVKGYYTSLTDYVDNPVINITVMLLIIMGGLGFFVWDDIRKNKWHIKKYRMQSKVVFTMTLLLILMPALYFYFQEFSQLPLKARIFSSLFQSITPRTAGFNTVSLPTISEAGLMIMIVLMLIGGSPGSTAGGMKTTTIAVLFSNALAVFRRNDQAHLYGRRIPDGAVKKAATVFLLYMTLFLAGGFIIMVADKIPMSASFFETASAIATVGLTVGITPGLSMLSKVILIILMYFGRVGGLTLVFATVSEKKSTNSKYPQERITVG